MVRNCESCPEAESRVPRFGDEGTRQRHIGSPKSWPPAGVLFLVLLVGLFSTPVQANENVLTLPLSFEPNVGQSHPDVDFLAHGDSYSVFLKGGGAVLHFSGGTGNHAVALDFVDPGNVNAGQGEDNLPGFSNYLQGRDRDQWHTDIPHYRSVLYRDLYSGIDLRYYGNQRSLEFDLVVEPGSDPGNIRLAVNGADKVMIDASGDLVLVLNEAEKTIKFRAPYSYQVCDQGKQQEISSSYSVHQDGTIGFELGDFDPTRTLIIDPVLDYGTYLGGTGTDRLKGLALDSAGNMYVTGHTDGAGSFPTTVGPQGGTGSFDAFVTKIAADGASLVYSTIVGGTGIEDAERIAVDASGYAYVTGNTSSTDFPVEDAYEDSKSGTYDAFVFVLQPAGNSLQYSTYWGSNGPTDDGLGIAVDASGSAVYVTGSVNSGTGFVTTTGVVDQTFGGATESYVTKFNPFISGTGSLIWSTFVGGSGDDIGYALSVDDAGNATVVGVTDSGDFQTTGGAFQGSLAARKDVFVAKLNSTATAYSYATYLGGSSDDQGEGVDYGPAGLIYVTGYSKSDFGIDFPTTSGAFDESHNGNWDGFVAVFDPGISGTGSLLYSTLFGGASLDRPLDVSVGPDGAAHLTGYVMSSDFPVSPDADDNSFDGSSDGFLFSCDPGGDGANDRIYASYLGGATADYGHELEADNAGNVVLGGYTDSSNFPTSTGAYDRTQSGSTTDGFVVRFSGFASGPSISGRVFEDMAGDVLQDGTIGSPRNPGSPGVDVYLYRDNGNTVMDGSDSIIAGPVATDALGNYSFSGLTDDTYFVRVDSRTIPSAQDPTAPVGDLWAVQTYTSAGGWCASGSGSGVLQGADGPCYGGITGIMSDSASLPLHYIRVTLAGSPAADIDFGFSFNVVVNSRGGDSADDDGTANRTVQGSLRQFLQNANAIDGPNAMRFVPVDPANDGDWWEVAVSNVLPMVTDAGTEVVGTAYDLADGITPRDTNGSGPEIELDGTGAGAGVDGLQMAGGNGTVRELAIHSFPDNGIELSSGANTVAGCYIGIDPVGAAALANSGSGILITGTANTNKVGGITVADRNLISGNTYDGIKINSATANSNSISGNYIGTDRTGAEAVPNGGWGVTIYGSSQGNQIGGTGAGEGNTIAFNTQDGIWIGSPDSDGNTMEGNTIYENGGLGIDLDPNGPGATNGANNNKGEPVITSVAQAGSDFNVEATVASTDAVEFFRATNGGPPVVDPDPSGYGEGYVYLGRVVDNGGPATGPHIDLVADGNPAPGVVEITLLGTGVSASDRISATATDAVNGTSEFAQNVPLAASNILVVDTVSDVLDGTITSIAALQGDPGPDGFISLREAITAANNTPNGAGFDEIHFAIAGAGPHTISPATSLPAVADPVAIDGATEPDFLTTPVVEIAGNVVGSGNGLNLSVGSDGSEIRGLAINRFDGHGIYILNSGTHTIAGNHLGIDPTGFTDRGNGGAGIYAVSSNNTIGGLSESARNVIGGNDGFGIGVIGSGSSGNTIIGNYIGLTADGNGLMINDDHAIEFSDAPDNTVGGITAGARNVICAGIGEACVYIVSSSATDNIVQGNFMGTNAAGTIELNGGTYGVRASMAPNTIIGGEAPGAGNLIAGYLQSGINGTGTGTVVQGNIIGTDATRTQNWGGMWGISLSTSAANWTIGGSNDGAGNIIANNSNQGIYLATNTGLNNRINRNEIYNNTGLAIDINNDGVSHNDLGDGDTGPNNVQNFPFLAAVQTDGGTNIAVSGHLDSSANTDFRLEFFANTGMHSTLHGEGGRYLGSLDVTTDAGGFHVFGSVLPGVNVAAGEYISATATDASGNTSEFSRHAVATPAEQIYVNTTSDVADGNTASLTNLSLDPGPDGLISLREAIAAANASPNGSGPDSILFDIPATDMGHFYYTDDGVPGQVDPGNIDKTYEEDDAAIVGIDPDFARSWYGVALSGTELPTVNDVVVIDGASQVGCVDSPIIQIDGSALSGATDGFDLDAGASTIRGFVINGFGWNGIDIQGANGNFILGNYIGTDPSGTLAKPNSVAGVGVSGSVNNEIGGASPGEGNLISGNTASGIQLDSAGNTVMGNLIGTTAGGDVALPNAFGVYVNNVDGNTIGGTGSARRNVISGNSNYGVLVVGDQAFGNTIAGNFIGTDATGNVSLSNNHGIYFQGGANDNTVGGLALGDRNIISGNTQSGVGMNGAATTGMIIQGNYIGLDATGVAAVPNGFGILVDGGAKGGTIGGSSPAARNVLSGNTNDGVNLNGTGVSNHTIIGNYIGTDAAGSAGVPNNNGVYIMGGASNNSVGGPLASDANLIAFNNYSGVSVHGASLDNAVLGNWLHSNSSSGLVGIDLGSDGLTPNNGTKSASQPNNDMDFPVLTSVSLAGTDLALEGYVGSASGQSLFAGARVELFESLPDGSGHGQGISFLGFLTTDVNGIFNGSIDVTGKGIVVGDWITATATDTDNNTSEYGADVTVAAPGSYEISGVVFEDVDFAGTASDYDGGTGDLALANVDVELYDGTDGYLASTVTAPDGSFNFAGLADGTFKIRARSASIGDGDTPPAGGLHPTVPGTWPYPLAEMSWGYGADLIGGQDLTVDDTAIGDNVGPGDTWVSVTVTGGSVTGVNLGFNYDLITNGDDDSELDTVRSKQGCLRQFIKNSNAIVGVNKSWFQIAIP